MRALVSGPEGALASFGGVPGAAPFFRSGRPGVGRCILAIRLAAIAAAQEWRAVHYGALTDLNISLEGVPVPGACSWTSVNDVPDRSGPAVVDVISPLLTSRTGGIRFL